MASKATPNGHNSLDPNEFLNHVRAVAAAKRTLAEAQSAHQHAMKKAKAAGINPAAFGAILQARKQEPEVIEQNMRDFARYARWLEMPIGTQPGLFGDDVPPVDEKAATEQREWAAEEAGYEAGRNGRNRSDCPFPAGSPFHARWDDGWVRGQAKIAEGLGPKKRGRPAGGKRSRGGNAEDGPGAEA
jgi:ribosome modulation factor